jgi:hypothetical protein
MFSRVADEVHSPTTRQNKEWQKKLPLVVLRAEEILYSKANSEVPNFLSFLWGFIVNFNFIVVEAVHLCQTHIINLPINRLYYEFKHFTAVNFIFSCMGDCRQNTWT